MDLQHQVVWVVGASAGIGAAVAREMQARGAKVAVTARSRTTLTEVSGGAMLTAPADITNVAALDSAANTIRGELGPVDILVITAADARSMDVTAWDRDDFAEVINTTLIGASNAIGAVLPDMIARRSGTIVGFVPPRCLPRFPGRRGLRRSQGRSSKPVGIIGC